MYDGDSAPGDFDDNGDDTLLLNGVAIGTWDQVATLTTDDLGNPISSEHVGFADSEVDTGWFYSNDPAALAALYSALQGSNQLVVQLSDVDPYDNYFDFTRGLDSTLIDVGTGPTIIANNPTYAVFTVTLSEVQATDVVVSYTTVDGTATGGQDYVPTSGTVTIPAGSLTATIQVEILYDELVEGNEVFYVQLSCPVGATLLDDLGVGTIIDTTPVDTVPIALDDENSVQEGYIYLTGSVAGNDDVGDDAVGAFYTAGTYTGSLGGTLELESDGSYVYVSPHNVDNSNGNPTETFTYTLTDGDGSPTTADLVISITDTGATGGYGEDYITEGSTETGLFVPAGSGLDAPVNAVDGFYTGSLGTVVEVTNGQFDYTAPVRDHDDQNPDYETFNFTVMDQDGSEATSTFNINITDTGASGGYGEDYVTEGSTETGLFVPAGSGLDAPVNAVDGFYTGSLGTVVEVTNGQFDYTAPVRDHDDQNPDYETFNFTVMDQDGSPATSTFSINIGDTGPTATDDTLTVIAGQGGTGTVDVQFVIDVSGSMGGSVANVPNFSDDRLGLARYSMQQLIINNAAIQNVQFVQFDDNAWNSVWMNRADALSYISTNNNWDDGGGVTNYDIALTQAMNSYDDSARPAGASDQTVVYFMSDGAPNTPGGDDAGITTKATGSNVSIGEWETWVNTGANDISAVFAIGLGSGVNVDNLEPIAYPNTDAVAPTGQEDTVVVLSDSNLSQLAATLDGLLQTVITPVGGDVTQTISGNVADDFGLDGPGAPKLVSVTYDADGSGPNAAVNVPLGVPFDLGAGRGTLQINADGSYTYTEPANATASATFSVRYTIQDGDGTPDDATLTINLIVPNSAPAEPMRR